MTTRKFCLALLVLLGWSPAIPHPKLNVKPPPGVKAIPAIPIQTNRPFKMSDNGRYSQASALAKFKEMTGPRGVSYYDIPTNKASRVVMTNGVVLVTVPKQVVQDSECESIPVATTNAQEATPIVDDLHPLTNIVDICRALGIDEARVE